MKECRMMMLKSKVKILKRMVHRKMKPRMNLRNLENSMLWNQINKERAMNNWIANSRRVK